MNAQQRQCDVSYDLNVFTKDFTNQTFPSIKAKLLEMGLDCDFHPDAIKGNKLPSGFLPMRMKVLQSGTKQYDEFQGDILTGFEMRTTSFNYEEEKAQEATTPRPVERQNFFQKLFSSPKPAGENDLGHLSGAIEARLATFDQNVSITCGQKHASEVRMALYFAVALADLTSGVVCDNYKGHYYLAADAAKHLAEMVGDYERSLHPPAWKMQSFIGWH